MTNAVVCLTLTLDKPTGSLVSYLPTRMALLDSTNLLFDNSRAQYTWYERGTRKIMSDTSIFLPDAVNIQKACDLDIRTTCIVFCASRHSHRLYRSSTYNTYHSSYFDICISGQPIHVSIISHMAGLSLQLPPCSYSHLQFITHLAYCLNHFSVRKRL